MELIQTLTLLENQKKASQIIGDAIFDINEVYKEWKKRERRRNAAKIITTSVNKLKPLSDNSPVVDHIHDAAKTKLAVIIMRCLDLPPWMEVETKRTIYNKLFNLLDKVETVSPNTDTGGNLREIICTRFSASITNSSATKEEQNVFVAYEPKVTKRYLKQIFGNEAPEHVVKMQTLAMPEDFDTLVNIITINHKKACDKYITKNNNKGTTK